MLLTGLAPTSIAAPNLPQSSEGGVDGRAIADAAGGAVTLEYDAAGRPKWIDNARGYRTTYAYARSTQAGMGWINTVTRPASAPWTTTSNRLGQPALVVDGNGNHLTHAYDAANRLVRVYDPAFVGTVGDYAAYAYDDPATAPITASASNGNGTLVTTADRAGRPLAVASPQGTVAYTSTGNGRRATMTLPAEGGGAPRTVTYGYDPASGDLASVTDWTGGGATAFAFDARGLPATVTRPNGVVTAYAYDRARRLAGISHQGPGGGYLAEYGYDYDANGNRTRLDVTGSAVPNGYETYRYDDLNRLDRVRDLDGDVVDVAYDANGNLATLTPAGGSPIQYGYDAADRLQTVDGVDLFDYDGNGNRLTHGADAYAWDWANRLTGATVGGTTTGFTYLADGSRATVAVGGGPAAPQLWDRAGGLPRLVDDGTTSAVHAGGGVLAEVDDATGDRAWALLDGLGSVRARTDGAGAVTDTGGWDAWGQATDPAEGRFGWAGEQTDPSTGLVYLRARYYSPLYGRFLSQDPVSPNGPGTQGYNPYAYATNNPTTLTDPSGMLPGLGGLGEAVGNAFAFVASVIECYLFGECRYGRRFAPGGGGEQPGSGGAAGAGSGAVVAAGPSVDTIAFCARLTPDLCGELLPGMPSAPRRIGNRGRDQLVGPGSDGTGGPAPAPTDSGRPPRDDGHREGGSDCAGVTGFGPTYPNVLTAVWLDDCYADAVALAGANASDEGLVDFGGENFLALLGPALNFLASKFPAQAAAAAPFLASIGWGVTALTIGDVYVEWVQRASKEDLIEVGNINAQGGHVGVVQIIANTRYQADGGGNAFWISQADWQRYNYCLERDPAWRTRMRGVCWGAVP